MDNKFIRAGEVAQELSVSNRQYFYERLYGAGKEEK